MSSHGELTAAMGERLEGWLVPLGYEVLYDHGDKTKANVGNIVCWFGGEDAPRRETELSQLDMAVVKSVSGRRQAVTLIEIEESDDRPKNLLGDLFGTLLADHVAFGGEELAVGAKTGLILMARGSVENQPRADRLVQNVRACRGLMLGRNSAIGHIDALLFNAKAELEEKLRHYVTDALGRF